MSEPRAVAIRSGLRRAAPWLIAAVAIAAVLIARAVLVTPPLARLLPMPSAAEDPAGTRAWIGSLAVPRGGPYLIGFQSPGPARLAISGGDLPPDGPIVMTGQGVVTRRVVAGVYTARDLTPDDPAWLAATPATAISLRFAAPPGARLLWLPPGRRGEPEYVPASALSPVPSAQAHFDGPDRSRADAVASLAIVVIMLALAGWLVRGRVRDLPRAILVGALAVLAVALVLRLESLGAAGPTWDEDTYWSAGRNYIHNLLAGDLDQAAWTWNQQHPPVSKYLAGLGAWWTDGYGPARAVSALVMALACALLVPIGARLHRPATGIAAGLVAAFTPHLIAHGQIVGHEAPTALAWALALGASLRVWDGVGARDAARADAREPHRANGEAEPVDERALRRRLIARFAVVGVVLGVAVMIRFVNVLAAPAIGLTIVVTAPRGRRLQAIGLGLAVIPLVAALTSIILWPRLWSHPIAHLDEAWTKLKGPHSQEPFLGALTSTPPRSYFLIYLAATAPLGLLLAAIVGLGAWARDPARRRALAVIAIWIAAPLGVMFSPVRQDGVRYIIPSLVGLAVLGGAGVVALGEVLARRRPRWLIAAPAALLVGYLAIVCARIRPFYLDYYGEQVGGTAAVARERRFEVAWWGEGLDRAIAYVNRHAGANDGVHRGCVEPIHLTWFRGDLWEPVGDIHDARWIVHYQPSWRPCPIPADAERVFTVSAGGAPLVHVYRTTAPSRIAPPPPPPLAEPPPPAPALPTEMFEGPR